MEVAWVGEEMVSMYIQELCMELCMELFPLQYSARALIVLIVR